MHACVAHKDEKSNQQMQVPDDVMIFKHTRWNKEPT
jgi:hypothetical protein